MGNTRRVFCFGVPCARLRETKQSTRLIVAGKLALTLPPARAASNPAPERKTATFLHPHGPSKKHTARTRGVETYPLKRLGTARRHSVGSEFV